VRVLRANGDPRWRDLLESGHARLQERASRLSDEAARLAFLANVPVNRELVAERAGLVQEGDA
jgi:hypothetical protein